MGNHGGRTRPARRARAWGPGRPSMELERRRAPIDLNQSKKTSIGDVREEEVMDRGDDWGEQGWT